MSAEHIRETLQQYVEVLLARGDYGRFFDDDIEFALVGTDQRSRGPEAAEQTIRFLHETAFDAEPEIANAGGGDPRRRRRGDVFVGTHTGEFSGVGKRDVGNAVAASRTRCSTTSRPTRSSKALRNYMPMDQLLARMRQVSRRNQKWPAPRAGRSATAELFKPDRLLHMTMRDERRHSFEAGAGLLSRHGSEGA